MSRLMILRRLSFVATVMLIVGLGDRQQSHADWSGWLGPNRDGDVAGFTAPSEWPDKLDREWSIKVGTGYGTPLVSGGYVYQHARQGDNEVLLCIDLESGEVKWQREYVVPFKMGGGGEKHGKGPKSCPTIADGRVFTMSITGDLIAWDAESGEQLWRSNFGERFEPNQPYWGVSTSPIVDGDRVIAHFGNDKQGVLVALDVRSGEEVWSQGNDGTSYSSPLVVEIDGTRQVLDWNHRALVAVDVNSGEFLWEFPFEHVGSQQNMPTPVFADGRVILGGENRGIHGLMPRKVGEEWKVDHLWHQEGVALDMATAISRDGLIFGMSHYDSGRIFCLDPKSGDVLWKGPPRVGENVTFLTFPDHVVALTNRGKLQIIRATNEQFDPVATFQTSDTETWAPPVLMDGAILIKDRETLSLWKF